jgi:hypothetical protein
MATTCPRCSAMSPETFEKCRECGRDLYHISYPAQDVPIALRLFRGPVRLTTGVAVLVIATGLVTGLLMQGGDSEETASNTRLPSKAVPRDPTPTPPPRTPKPSKTAKPPAPAPTTTPPPPSPSGPPHGKGPKKPQPSFSSVEEAIEWAREMQEKYGHGGPPPGHWNQGAYYEGDGQYYYDDNGQYYYEESTSEDGTTYTETYSYSE